MIQKIEMNIQMKMSVAEYLLGQIQNRSRTENNNHQIV